MSNTRHTRHTRHSVFFRITLLWANTGKTQNTKKAQKHPPHDTYH
jgi:hypothetical protein